MMDLQGMFHHILPVKNNLLQHQLSAQKDNYYLFLFDNPY